jgi:hypothetical protein
MKFLNSALIVFMMFLSASQSRAIDLSPPPSGNGVSDVYESLYPGTVWDDDPLTGDACLPIREDITVGPWTNREKSILGAQPSLGLAMPLVMEVATGGTSVTLRFPTVLGKRYQVQTGQVEELDEPDWITVEECEGPHVYKAQMVRTNVGSEIIGTGDEAVATLSITLVSGEPQYFNYTCLGDIFSDDDEFSDWEESVLELDPESNSVDIDGDGRGDEYEAFSGTTIVGKKDNPIVGLEVFGRWPQ